MLFLKMIKMVLIGLADIDGSWKQEEFRTVQLNDVSSKIIMYSITGKTPKNANIQLNQLSYKFEKLETLFNIICHVCNTQD